ncbi:universal stress protein [Natrialbaceae archaeon AArc-T1-2]|uniref:universal stress protein n=1 Tax=Natrialbaceae archaeon AArc-T1-2 TaxID=3053904 RepID=UPI00255A7E5F|nr:universal stress protein [Natrialbaceae archaeon AArc-T1-2]WIV68032.1 universal stress protein [Natrialbaceae archaeon AArc-T1-2]
MTHYLVPTDGSEQATEALRHVLERDADPEVTVLYVVELGRTGPEEFTPKWVDAELQHDAEKRAEETLEDAQSLAAEYDLEIETATAMGKPARSIVEYAEKADVDHVVMGSHGRDGLSRVLLGSVAETVVRRASVPVTVVR